MARELKMLEKSPPEGVCCWPAGDSITNLRAQMQGPPNTVYEQGVFELTITLPERYPVEPPKIVFATPVYHPNIDTQGRICCDLLNMPPKGSWGPALNLVTVLSGIRQLLAEPNPKDPLMGDVTEEYLNNRGLFEMKARQHVATHAQCCTCSAPPGGASAAVVPAALPAAGVVEGAGEPPIAPAAGAASSSEAAALPAMGSSGGQPASAAQQPDAVAAGNAATPGSRAAGVGAENEAPAHGVHQHPEGGGAAQALVKRRRLGMGQGKPMAEAVNQAG